MSNIHPTAIIHPGAKLGEAVQVGPFSVIHDDVTIGDGCRIASHVVIDSGSRLGERVEVFTGAVLGTAPQDLKYAGEKTYLEVGDETTIREYATLNRGTIDHGKTEVGKKCLIMAYVHVAHDCIIGDKVIISNAVNMAGHVEIGSHAGIGGLTAIHQFVKIGNNAFIGGGLRVSQDVPPFILAMGDPLRYGGVNSVGLSRKGFSKDEINNIKRTYKIVFQENLRREEALEKISSTITVTPIIESIIAFIKRAERGMIRGTRK